MPAASASGHGLKNMAGLQQAALRDHRKALACLLQEWGSRQDELLAGLAGSAGGQGETLHLVARAIQPTWTAAGSPPISALPSGTSSAEILTPNGSDLELVAQIPSVTLPEARRLNRSASKQSVVSTTSRWSQEDNLEPANTDYDHSPGRRSSTLDRGKTNSFKGDASVPHARPSQNSLGSRESLTEKYDLYNDIRKMQASTADADRYEDPIQAAKLASKDVLVKDLKIQRFVRGRLFRALSAILILSNALLMGCHLQYASYEQVAPQSLTGFRTALAIFSCFFAIELALRIIADGMFGFFSVPWHCADCAIIISSVLGFMLDLIGVSFPAGDAILKNSSIVRIIQVFRILRLSRTFRMLRVIKPLRVLVGSIANTYRALFWAMTMLILIMYIFAVAITQGTLEHGIRSSNSRQTHILNEYYGSIPRCIFTLFMVVCNGVDWSTALEPLIEVHWLYSCFFVVYVAFVYFAVLNVVTGVFVQDSIESAAKDKDEVVAEQLSSKGFYVTKLKECFGDMDKFDDGMVSFAEFERQMNSDSSSPLKAYMALLDIDASNAWEVFKLLDVNDKLSIDLDEFVEGCLRLQGDAKCIDIAKMQHEIRWMMNQLSADFDEALSSIRRPSRAEAARNDMCFTPPNEEDAAKEV